MITDTWGLTHEQISLISPIPYVPISIIAISSESFKSSLIALAIPNLLLKLSLVANISFCVFKIWCNVFLVVVFE